MRNEFFNKKNIKLDLYMVNCGYEDCCPNFVCPPHIRSYFLIHFITKGIGFYKVNEKVYTLKKGDAFIIYPDEIVTYYSPDINNSWSFCWIGFNGKSSDEYLKLSGITNHIYTKSLNNFTIYSGIRNCLEYISENDGCISQIMLNHYLMKCLSAFTENTTKHEKSVNHVDKAIRYIEYNYMNAISVKTIAEFLSLDRTYFYRIFKKYTGSSPETYLINYRIKKAIELIENGGFSINSIAECVGIRDPYYFSKIFKKVTGNSPSKYKKM